MIHYAIYDIYEPPEAPQEYALVDYNGIEVLACKTEQGYVLDRIYSTNPGDFLNQTLQPGTLLQNSLINKIIQ